MKWCLWVANIAIPNFKILRQAKKETAKAQEKEEKELYESKKRKLEEEERKIRAEISYDEKIVKQHDENAKTCKKAAQSKIVFEAGACFTSFKTLFHFF